MNIRRFIFLVMLLLIALAAIFSTRFALQPPSEQGSAKSSPAGQSMLVDEQPLMTAQALAVIAVTPLTHTSFLGWSRMFHSLLLCLRPRSFSAASWARRES